MAWTTEALNSQLLYYRRDLPPLALPPLLPRPSLVTLLPSIPLPALLLSPSLTSGAAGLESTTSDLT